MTTKSKAGMLAEAATAFDTGGLNSAAEVKAFQQNLIDSLFGCHGTLQNLGSNKTLILTSTTTELGGAITPWIEANTYNDGLVADPVTGRVTCPSDNQAGRYIVGYTMTIQPDIVTAPFPASLPEQITVVMAKNAASFFGTPAKAFALPKPMVNLALPVPISASTSIQVGGLESRFNASRLVIQSAGAVSGGTDAWTGMQVTNLGPTGSGTSTLFASAKTTNGSSLTAGVARGFNFDQNTAIAAGDVLKVDITKTGSPTALQVVSVQGNQSYSSGEVCFQMHGYGLVDLVANDYFSMRGNIAGAFGTFTALAGIMWWRRVGGA